MITPAEGRELITAAPAEMPALIGFLEALDGRQVRLIGSHGRVVAVPRPLREVLRQAAQLLASGDGVVVMPRQHELTTQEAADVINVSRQYVVQLCDRGDLPCTKVGSHRRIRCGDLLAFKRRRDASRRKSLRQLAALSQELGMYDAPPPDDED